MVRESLKAEDSSSELGWLFTASLGAGLASETLTPLGLLGGVAVLLGYMAGGGLLPSVCGRLRKWSGEEGATVRSVRYPDVVLTFWPLVLAGSLAANLAVVLRRRLFSQPVAKTGV